MKRIHRVRFVGGPHDGHVCAAERCPPPLWTVPASVAWRDGCPPIFWARTVDYRWTSSQMTGSPRCVTWFHELRFVPGSTIELEPDGSLDRTSLVDSCRQLIAALRARFARRGNKMRSAAEAHTASPNYTHLRVADHDGSSTES